MPPGLPLAVEVVHHAGMAGVEPGRESREAIRLDRGGNSGESEPEVAGTGLQVGLQRVRSSEFGMRSEGSQEPDSGQATEIVLNSTPRSALRARAQSIRTLAPNCFCSELMKYVAHAASIRSGLKLIRSMLYFAIDII